MMLAVSQQLCKFVLAHGKKQTALTTTCNLIHLWSACDSIHHAGPIMSGRKLAASTATANTGGSCRGSLNNAVTVAQLD